MLGRDFLERFRPTAAPGTVARVGVPTGPRRESELDAVLARLDADQEALAEALRAAEQTAQELMQAAERQADAIVAEAELDAAEQRAAAVATAERVGRGERDRLLERAGREAERIRQDAERDRPRTVRLVLDSVRAQLGLAGLADTVPDSMGEPGAGGRVTGGTSAGQPGTGEAAR